MNRIKMTLVFVVALLINSGAVYASLDCSARCRGTSLIMYNVESPNDGCSAHNGENCNRKNYCAEVSEIKNSPECISSAKRSIQILSQQIEQSELEIQNNQQSN